MKFSSKAQSSLPNLYDVAKNGAYDSAASGIYIDVTSMAGTTFTVFGKNTAWVRGAALYRLRWRVVYCVAFRWTPS